MIEISFAWGIKQSFLRYLANLPGTQASVGGGAAFTKDNRFVFPAAEGVGKDGLTAAGTVKFEGEVRLTAHGGMLDLVLSDPWVDIDRRTARLSFVTNRSAGPGLVRTVVCELLEQPGESDDSRRAWEARLADSGVHVFGDTYAAGEVLDPAHFLSSPLSVPRLEHLS